MAPSVVRTLTELKAQLCHPHGAGGKGAGVQSALYDHGPLGSFLAEVFGSLSISDADRFLHLTSLEHGVSGVGVVCDHNMDSPSTRPLSEMLLPIMSTPILWPTARRGFDAGFAFPNTASAAAFAIASKFKIPFSEIIIVSICGAPRTRDLPIDESLNWGAQQWLPYMAQVSRDASARLSQLQLGDACGERFIHFAPALGEAPLLLDECNAEAVQKAAAEADVTPLVDFVRQRMAEL